MKFLFLTKKLTTGMKAVDDQHREFFRRINAFSRHCAEAECSRERVIHLFGYLHAYGIEHFRFETELMKEYEYPGMAEHLREHKRFREYVEKTRAELATRELSIDFTLQVNYFLVDWFKEHIQLIDRKMTGFLTEVAHQRADHKLLALIKGLLPGGT